MTSLGPCLDPWHPGQAKQHLTWHLHTTSDDPASMSTTFPLPSSPHCAPSTTVTLFLMSFFGRFLGEQCCTPFCSDMVTTVSGSRPRTAGSRCLQNLAALYSLLGNSFSLPRPSFSHSFSWIFKLN